LWYAAAGFFLFRFFDIIKPFPLRRLEKLSGGLGVMLDDIGAGIYTNLVLQAAVLYLPR
jgi:phosphatidylglycerophosphatase A